MRGEGDFLRSRKKAAPRTKQFHWQRVWNTHVYGKRCVEMQYEELRSDEVEHTHTNTHSKYTYFSFWSFLDKVRELQNSLSTAASSRTPGPLFNKGHHFVSQAKGKTKDFCSTGVAFCWVWRKLKERRLRGLKETATLKSPHLENWPGTNAKHNQRQTEKTEKNTRSLQGPGMTRINGIQI